MGYWWTDANVIKLNKLSLLGHVSKIVSIPLLTTMGDKELNSLRIYKGLRIRSSNLHTYCVKKGSLL